MSDINKDVNYRLMAGNARLVMLGESSHNILGYKFEVIKALKQLKLAGFTHFAMEMLSKDMKEKVDYYQKTGNGLEVIRQFFKENWAWGYLVPDAYAEVVRIANSIGMKIVPLDLPYEAMDLFDKGCSFDDAKARKCLNTHTIRNMIWADTITSVLNESSQNRVVAFMHRLHAVRSADFQEGIDTLIQDKGVHKIRFIDFIGGLYCREKNKCRPLAQDDPEIKDKYFYLEGYPYKSAVKSFQVHIPEKKLNADGSFQ